MRIEHVEIYSDQSNAVVMRHPGRRFPGLLVQGDAVSEMCREGDRACAQAANLLSEDGHGELNDLRGKLRAWLDEYTRVLQEHGLPLPFPI